MLTHDCFVSASSALRVTTSYRSLHAVRRKTEHSTHNKVIHVHCIYTCTIQVTQPNTVDELSYSDVNLCVFCLCGVATTELTV